MFFYRKIETETTITLSESFEFTENWTDTISNTHYYLTYTFNSTNSQQDSFETSEGW